MSRMVRITLRVDAALLADIDRHCRRIGCSRSALIREALRWHIDREQKRLKRRKGGHRLRGFLRGMDTTITREPDRT